MKKFILKAFKKINNFKLKWMLHAEGMSLRIYVPTFWQDIKIGGDWELKVFDAGDFGLWDAKDFRDFRLRVTLLFEVKDNLFEGE